MCIRDRFSRYWRLKLKNCWIFPTDPCLTRPLGVTHFEFCNEIWHQNTRIAVLQDGEELILTQYRRVTDRRIDRETDTLLSQKTQKPELGQRSAGKTYWKYTIRPELFEEKYGNLKTTDECTDRWCYQAQMRCRLESWESQNQATSKLILWLCLSCQGAYNSTQHCIIWLYTNVRYYWFTVIVAFVHFGQINKQINKIVIA